MQTQVFLNTPNIKNVLAMFDPTRKVSNILI